MLLLAPGANVAIGLLLIVNPTMGSVITIFVRVVFPVLVTANVYVITSPTRPVPDTIPVFTKAMLGLGVKGVTVQVRHVGSTGHVVHGVGSVEVPVTLAPVGGVPTTVAKLYTTAASISDCEIVCIPVNVVLSDAPAANVARGPPVMTALGSVTVIALRSVSPVLVTTKA